MSKRNQRASGFTVLELMVAVGIAMVVLGIAVPSLLTWMPTLRLSSGARQVATDLQVARMKAISQNTKYKMIFVGSIPGATSYRIEKDNGGFVLESGPFSLPDGITILSAPTTSVFQPRGTVDTSSEITLQNVNSETKKVQVAAVGRVNIP